MSDAGQHPGLRAAIDLLGTVLQEEIDDGPEDEELFTSTLVVRGGATGLGFKLTLTIEQFQPGSGELEKA